MPAYLQVQLEEKHREVASLRSRLAQLSGRPEGVRDNLPRPRRLARFILADIHIHPLAEARHLQVILFRLAPVQHPLEVAMLRRSRRRQAGRFIPQRPANRALDLDLPDFPSRFRGNGLSIGVEERVVGLVLGVVQRVDRLAARALPLREAISIGKGRGRALCAPPKNIKI
jgi:hypothetical protein